jgi:hypothetical protein
MRNTLLILIVAVGTGLLIVFLKFGTIDPCGILRVEVRQEAAREDSFGGVIASALPDSIIDGIIAIQYGPLSPGRCIALAFSVAPQPATPAPQSVAEGLNYEGKWVADVPVQGSCPASHMTLFVHGAYIAGSVVNPAGTFAISGQIDGNGNGDIQINGSLWRGRIKFSHDQFAADYFNNCGERRAIGKRLIRGQTGDAGG